MFEVAEVGRRVSKAQFKAREGELRTRLLTAQRRAAEHNVPVIIIVSGVEGAGKGSVVDRLMEWLDARGLTTVAFWNPTDEEQARPRYWRYWRALPPRGGIGVLFGSWYTDPIVSHALDKTDDADLASDMDRVREFERMLAVDGALIVKFWFHLSHDGQLAALKADRKNGRRSPLLKSFSKHYRRFLATSEMALRLTDTALNPWFVIESGDGRYRDLTVGETLARAIEQRLAREDSTSETDVAAVHAPQAPDVEEARRTVLDTVPLERVTTPETYSRQLKRLQTRAHGLAWDAHRAGVNTVAVFEGWDAAGKGGAIRRLTQALDARLFRVIPIAAPTDEERAHHYLWRFWRHLPPGGYITMYDRSWYGRVLVERVEGFATPDAWGRAYSEINEFEAQLTEHGAAVLKFWLHIDAEEQLRRFREREVTPWKQHKITDEDWRNRDRWDDYVHAVNDMVARTSTAASPWTLVAANDKKSARLEVLKTFCETLEARLGKA